MDKQCKIRCTPSDIEGESRTFRYRVWKVGCFLGKGLHLIWVGNKVDSLFEEEIKLTPYLGKKLIHSLFGEEIKLTPYLGRK